jgi:hypothetical protein
VAWILLALIFCGGLWWYLNGTMGREVADDKAMEFLSGYLIEKSLAVDNIFVWLMLFSFFAVPAELQRRVPLLDAIAGEYGDRITVIAINRMEERTLAGAYLGTLPQLSHLHVLTDPADTFFKGVGGYAMPETVVYAADGSIAFHTRGVVVEAELRAALDALLAK